MKWENGYCHRKNLEELWNHANERGELHWEVVSVFFNGSEYVAWFKREILDSPADKQPECARGTVVKPTIHPGFGVGPLGRKPASPAVAEQPPPETQAGGRDREPTHDSIF